MSQKFAWGVGDTVAGGGSVTTPAAAAVIASTAVLASGTYDVEVTVALSGTAETKTTNLQLQNNTGNTTVVQAGLLSISAQTVKIRLSRVTVDGTVGLSVAATALATTGAIYNVFVAAQKVE